MRSRTGCPTHLEKEGRKILRISHGASDLLRPCNGGNSGCREAVIDLMLRLVADTGAALLMVTHSARIAALADRSLHLSHGRLAP